MKTPDSPTAAKAVCCDDLFAVLAPVLDWYQSDEHPPRAPLEILSDIIADLQFDRAAAMLGAKDARRLDFMDAHPCSTEVRGGMDDGHEGKAWAIAAHGGNLRDAIDAWMVSVNASDHRTARE